MNATAVQKKRAVPPKIAIIAGRFNEPICVRLLEGCLDQLKKHGLRERDIFVTWVPGAFEIPIVALKYAKKKSVDAVICLGAIIEGQTDHYRLVADNAARGIMDVGLTTEKPVVFEILAASTVELANQRSQLKGINKGRDAADVAVEMIKTLKEI